MQSMCHGKKLIRIWKHVLTKMPKNKILYLTHPKIKHVLTENLVMRPLVQEFVVEILGNLV